MTKKFFSLLYLCYNNIMVYTRALGYSLHEEGEYQ